MPGAGQQASGTMHILLVHAEFPITYWGFQHALALIDKRASLPPLGLVTVAAHLPGDWPVRLVDLNVEPLHDAQLDWADAVLVGGMRIQAPSMHQVIARAKARGRRVVVGGPAATTSPDEFQDADVVFCGEVEGREAELESAVLSSQPRVLAAGPRPDLGLTRVPRFDLLDLSAYTSMSVQYSRGCPFHCEFCDIIEIFGRVPRVKPNASLLGELDSLHRLGWSGTVFIVDDNFIGNRRQVATLLPELQAWQAARAWPLEFYTEASVDLALAPKLVDGMVQAGFRSVFLGIETASTDSLREVGKTQNLRIAPQQAVETLARAGLEVMAGFIVGFDNDDAAALLQQRAFLSDAPIPLAMVGLLTALPGTALWRRLEREGRLRTMGAGENFVRPNFTPRMDEEQLLDGYAQLLRWLYAPERYFARCRAHLALTPILPQRVRKGGVRTGLLALWRLGVLSQRRVQFWRLLLAAIRRSPGLASWAVEKALQGEHLFRYTAEHLTPRMREAVDEVRREGQAMVVAA